MQEKLISFFHSLDKTYILVMYIANKVVRENLSSIKNVNLNPFMAKVCSGISLC